MSDLDPARPDTYLPLIAACLPGLEVGSAIPITSGWDSLVFEVNGDLILRIARRPEVETQFERERRLLPLLASVLPVEVPEFTAHAGHSPACSLRFVTYRKIPGVPLPAVTSGSLAPAGTQQMGDILSALHATPPDLTAHTGIPRYSPETWRASYQAFYVWIQRQVYGLVTSGVQQHLRSIFETYLSQPAHFRFHPCIVHGDLAAEHILCDPATGAIRGIIDWSDARVGDPALDFSDLLHRFGPDFTARVLEHYTVDHDATLLDRARFYVRLFPLYEIQFGINTGTPEHVQQGLAALPAYLPGSS